jgi:sn-glycerol 3-phosphate transport system substrate-binding protein
MNSQLQISLTALTDEYNASQTKVHVTLVNQNGYEQVIEKYKAASPADRPALVQMPDYTLQLLADSDTVIPVQSCINAEHYDLSDFLPRAVAYYTLRSALQGMPFNISNPVLYYNRADFVKAGLDPDTPPTSLEDLRAVSQKIVDSGAAKYGIALDHSLDAGGGWYLEQWLAKAGKLYSNNENGRAAPSTNVLFNGTTGVELLTFLQDMVRDGLAIDVGPLTSGFDNLLKLADPKEPAAMTIATAAALAAVLNVLNGGGVQGITNADLGIGPLPGPTVNPGTLVGGAALWLPQGKSDLETAAAWDYIKFLVGAQQQSDWAASTGYVPVRDSSVDLPPLKDTYLTDPRFKVAYDQLLAAADTPVQAGPVLGPQREVRVITSHAVEDVLTHGADVKQTLDAAARQSDLLIAQWTKVEGS